MVVELLVAGAAAVVAGFFCWMLAAARSRSRFEASIRDWETRARVAESDATAARDQIKSLRSDADALRSRQIELERDKAASEARLSEAQEGLGAQRDQLTRAEIDLSHTFKALAAEALRSNNEGFLTLAEAKFSAARESAERELEAKRLGVERLVTPVRDTLASLDQELRKIEGDRRESQGKLTEQLASLGARTERLVDALKTPSVRGRWGEIQLRRVVEIAGMVEYCDFDEQAEVAGRDGRLRPDMTVRLPAGKNVIVDAKAPLQAYMEAIESPDEAQRALKLRDHARQIRNHIGELSSKSYWEACEPTPEFVVLFLPGEMFFSAALQHDPALIEDGANRKVILATPTTLIALLKAVAYGWRQERVAENALRISELGRELYERIARMAGHLAEVRRTLDGSVKAFNRTVGSFKERVLPAARRFKELGVSGRGEIARLEPIDVAPREIAGPESGTEESNGHREAD